MTTVKDILDRARGELGVTEASKNLTKYGDWYGLNGQPWCAIFVSWVFYHEGLPLAFTTPKGFAAVQVGISKFKAMGRWYTSGPKPGDLVFFTYSHVGIVESVNGDGSIVSIEGNSSDRVQQVKHKSDILGYGRPNYSSTPEDWFAMATKEALVK